MKFISSTLIFEFLDGKNLFYCSEFWSWRFRITFQSQNWSGASELKSMKIWYISRAQWDSIIKIRTISKTKVKSSKMKTFQYALALAVAFSASSEALEISSTSKCKAEPMRQSYCEFGAGDVVLTCNESQSPDPQNKMKTELLLDCGTRKLQVRKHWLNKAYKVRTFHLNRCPNQQIDRLVM